MKSAFFFEIGGHSFMALEHLSCTLYEFLFAWNSSRSMSICEVRRLSWFLLRSLSALAELNLVHGDVKPENVMFSGSRAFKLVDFGTAAVANKHAGRRFQTPWYMAPEVAMRHAYDCRADVFSAGAVIFEAFVGRAAFPSDNPWELVELMEAWFGPFPEEIQKPPYWDGRFRGIAAVAPEDLLDAKGAPLPDPRGWARRRAWKLENFEAAILDCDGDWAGALPAAVEKQREIRRDLLDLLRGMLDLDYRKRLTAAEALEHRFFTAWGKMS
jgi:serine/threonine protein kinase